MITTLWSINMGICLALAALHLMRLATPEDYGTAIRILHVPAAIVAVSMVWSEAGPMTHRCFGQQCFAPFLL